MKPPTRRTPEELAWEILAYLNRAPEAMDTLEGVARWWFLQQRIVQTTEDVQSALTLLIQEGHVQTWQGPEGRIFYRRNAPKETSAPSKPGKRKQKPKRNLTE